MIYVVALEIAEVEDFIEEEAFAWVLSTIVSHECDFVLCVSIEYFHCLGIHVQFPFVNRRQLYDFAFVRSYIVQADVLR